MEIVVGSFSFFIVLVVSGPVIPEELAGRAHGALDLPQRAAPLVGERVERADVGQRRQLVAAQAGALDDLLDRREAADRAAAARSTRARRCCRNTSASSARRSSRPPRSSTRRPSHISAHSSGGASVFVLSNAAIA